MALLRELSKHGTKFDREIMDDVAGQVKAKMFDFSAMWPNSFSVRRSDAKKMMDFPLKDVKILKKVDDVFIHGRRRLNFVI